MSIDKVKISNLTVSKLIIGGNPFSGFSHQGADRDGDEAFLHRQPHQADPPLEIFLENVFAKQHGTCIL